MREVDGYCLSNTNEHYTIFEELKGGGKYVGLMLDWDYEGKQVHSLMSEYAYKALRRFGHEKPRNDRINYT